MVKLSEGELFYDKLSFEDKLFKLAGKDGLSKHELKELKNKIEKKLSEWRKGKEKREILSIVQDYLKDRGGSGVQEDNKPQSIELDDEKSDFEKQILKVVEDMKGVEISDIKEIRRRLSEWRKEKEVRIEDEEKEIILLTVQEYLQERPNRIKEIEKDRKERKEKEKRIGIWGIISGANNHLNKLVEAVEGKPGYLKRFGQLSTMVALQMVGNTIHLLSKEKLQNLIDNRWNKDVKRPFLNSEGNLEQREGGDPKLAEEGDYIQEVFHKKEQKQHNPKDALIRSTFENFKAMIRDRDEQQKAGVSITPLKRESGKYTAILDWPIPESEIYVKVEIEDNDLDNFDAFKQKIEGQIDKRNNTNNPRISLEQHQEFLDQASDTLYQDASLQKAILDINDYTAADLRIQVGKTAENITKVHAGGEVNPLGLRFTRTIRHLYSFHKVLKGKNNEKLVGLSRRAFFSSAHAFGDGLELGDEALNVYERLHDYLSDKDEREEPIDDLVDFEPSQKEQLGKEGEEKPKMVGISVGKDLHHSEKDSDNSYLDIVNLCSDKNEVYRHFLDNVKNEEGEALRLNFHTIMNLALMLSLGIDNTHYLEKNGTNLVPVIAILPPALRRIFDESKGNMSSVAQDMSEEEKDLIENALFLFQKGRFGDARGDDITPGRGEVPVMAVVADWLRDKLSMLGKITNPKGAELLTDTGALVSMLAETKGREDKRSVGIRSFSPALASISGHSVGVSNNTDGTLRLIIRADKNSENLVYKKYGDEKNPEKAFKRELERAIKVVISVLTEMADKDNVD